jgi:hypothetical protein
MKRIICFSTLSVLYLITLSCAGQNEIEALRYSGSYAGWSARSLGMAGAYSSIGADLSSFYSNPAGLALYKRSSMELALSHDVHTTETDYTGVMNKDLQDRLSIGNAAFVASRKPRNNRVLQVSYGLAYSKTNNFYQNFTIEGKAANSLMEQFAMQAQGTEEGDLYNTFPFGAGLAYEIYGIDPNPDDPSGTGYIAATAGEFNQRKRVQREGRQNETTLGLALQYGDNLYLGASAGITGIYFSEISNYTEEYPTENRLPSWSFDEDLSTFGTGFVARIGAIYRAHERFRVSASYQTKTITYLQDYYSVSAASLVDSVNYNSASPELIAEYILRSPSQWTLGASFMIGKIGMISADWAQSDYRQISMSGTDENTYDYKAENELFDSLFQRTHHLRFGAEARILGGYYARWGYSIQQSALSDAAKSIDSPALGWSAGIGYRDDHLFADLALLAHRVENSYYLYDPALVEQTTIRDRMIRTLLSVGVRF